MDVLDAVLGMTCLMAFYHGPVGPCQLIFKFQSVFEKLCVHRVALTDYTWHLEDTFQIDRAAAFKTFSFIHVILFRSFSIDNESVIFQHSQNVCFRELFRQQTLDMLVDLISQKQI